MTRVRPIYLLYVSVLLLVNLILKIWYIDVNDIAHDEPFTLFFAQGDPASIIENLKPYNNPPLYEILLHYWTDWFGNEPMAARMLSCIFSSLAAVALFHFAFKNWNLNVALSAGLIFTFSTFQISFAHEARAYSLFVLLTILSIHFLIAAMEEKGKKANWVFYILFTSLLLYTHFFSIWVVFIQIVYLLKRGWFLKKQIWIAAGCILILYAPYIFILMERFSDSAAKGTWLPEPTAGALYENIRHFSNKPVNAVIFLGILVSGIIYFFRNKISFAKTKTDLLLIWFFVPYILMFFISFRMPMFLGRYLIFITPAFCVLIPLLWGTIWQKNKYQGFLLLIPALLMAATVNVSPSNDLEPSKVAKIIKPYYENHVPIVLSPVSNDIIIAYHLDKDLFTYRDNYREYEKERNFIPENEVSKIDLMEELIFIETPNHYLDRDRNNLNYLFSRYKQSQKLLYDGSSPKGFEVYLFRGLK